MLSLSIRDIPFFLLMSTSGTFPPPGKYTRVRVDEALGCICQRFNQDKIDIYPKKIRKIMGKSKWIKNIEKKYNTKIIVLFGEFTDYVYDMFIRQLREIDTFILNHAWITIVIHTNGGDADVALKIADVMRKHKCRFRVVVPINAGSAGAYIGMSADELILGSYAYLTPFDTVMGNISLKNITDFDLDRCITTKDFNRVKEARHEKHIAMKKIQQMFHNRYPQETIDKIYYLFIEHSTSHDHPIGYDDIVTATGVTHIHQQPLCKWFHRLVQYYIDGTLGESSDEESDEKLDGEIGGGGFRYTFYKNLVKKMK